MAVTVNLSISLDGYYTGASPSSVHPLGQAGEPLHDWFAHEGASRDQLSTSDILAEEFERLGAMIMGRDSYEHAQAEWGEAPPFEVPVFVVTHRSQPDDVRQGTTFHFITDGFTAALERAQEAAGAKNVVLHGGGAIQQGLRSGRLDELQLHVVPMLLHSGRSLFESLDYDTIQLDQDRAIAGLHAYSVSCSLRPFLWRYGPVPYPVNVFDGM